MDEIRINNSRLRIIPITGIKYSSSCRELLINEKSRLRYQFIVCTDPSSSSMAHCSYHDIRGVSKIVLSSSGYNNYWGIEYVRGIEKYSGEIYTDHDKYVILSFLALIPLGYTDVAELLCHALGDDTILKHFYESYGSGEYYRNYIVGIINKLSSYEFTPPSRFYPITYSGSNHYSVVSLLKDLVKDGSSILLDPDLIGKYNRISSSDPSHYPSNVKVLPDRWCEVMGICGNKSRANLSLHYKSKVEVSIPPVVPGIASGAHVYDMLKNVCIVHNGILNLRYLGVRVSPSLASKFKRLGLVKDDLIYSNDYLLDLSRIPIVSRSSLRRKSTIYVTKLAAEYYRTKLISGYVNYLYNNKKFPERSESELYLNRLGIYGDYYFLPNSSQRTSSSDVNPFSGGSLELRLCGVRSYNFTKDYKSYSESSSCDDIVIKKVLDSQDFSGDINELKVLWDNRLKDVTTRYQEWVFSVIMSKSYKFSNCSYGVDEASWSTNLLPHSKIRILVTWNYGK